MMKLSPREIGAASFDTRMGGYDKAQVRAYLNDLSYSVESLLRDHQSSQQRFQELQEELQARRQAEDEMRRALLAAERMAYEVRDSAMREAQMIMEQTQLQVADLQREQERRSAEAELMHQQRLAELDTAFRARYIELERDHYEWVMSREREHNERMAEMERQYTGRFQELSERFASARQEYAQFLTTYRALLSSFGELSLRHALPEETGVAQDPLASPGTGLPAAWVTSDVMQALPDLPAGLAEAILGAAATPLHLSPPPPPSILDKDGLDVPSLPPVLNTSEVLSRLPGAVPTYAEGPLDPARDDSPRMLGRHRDREG